MEHRKSFFHASLGSHCEKLQNILSFLKSIPTTQHDSPCKIKSNTRTSNVKRFLMQHRQHNRIICFLQIVTCTYGNGTANLFLRQHCKCKQLQIYLPSACSSCTFCFVLRAAIKTFSPAGLFGFVINFILEFSQSFNFSTNIRLPLKYTSPHALPELQSAHVASSAFSLFESRSREFMIRVKSSIAEPNNRIHYDH